MRAALLVLACTACGRIGFDARTDAGNGSPADPTRSLLTLTPPGEALVDFPLLVVLDDTRADRTLIGDGSTLRFLDSGSNVIPYEIEQLGSPGGPPLLAWVRVQVPIAGTTLTVEYGGNGAAPATDPVWGPDFVAVWHLAADGLAPDSTGHGLDAAATGSQASAALVGVGRAFQRSSQEYLVTPSSPPLTNAFTISAGFSARSLPAALFQGAVTQQFGTAGDNSVYLGVVGFNAVMTCETGTGEHDGVGSRVLATQTFYYLTATATATTGSIYVDGALDGTVATNGALVFTALPLFISGDRSDTSTATNVPTGDFIDGILDEVRVQNLARSAAWIDYDARTVRDQVITYGPIIRP